MLTVFSIWLCTQHDNLSVPSVWSLNVLSIITGSLCFRFNFTDNIKAWDYLCAVCLVTFCWWGLKYLTVKQNVTVEMSNIYSLLSSVFVKRPLLHLLPDAAPIFASTKLFKPPAAPSASINLYCQRQEQATTEKPSRRWKTSDSTQLYVELFKYKAELNSMNKTFSGLPFCQPFNQSIQKTLYIAAYVYLRYLP